MKRSNSTSSEAVSISYKQADISKLEQLLSYLPFERFRNPARNIAVVRLSGIISSHQGLKNSLNFENVNNMLESAFKIKRLTALCLLINSPGGSPVQTEFIASRIRQLATKNNVPVYGFVEDVAASGGYWLACAADKIYASKSSIIGSIGVILKGFGFYEAIRKFGIERRVYTEGKNKSILDPFSPEKEEDVKIIKKVQVHIHNHFIDYIKTRRGSRITQDDDVVFNGEFWSGEIAQDFGLIDGIDNLYSFIEREFGDNVNLKFIDQKQSWLRRRLGLSNLVAELTDNILLSVKKHIQYDKYDRYF